MKYKNLVNSPGRKAKIYRWIGIIGSNLLRKGRMEVTREIRLEGLFPKGK